MSDVVNAAVAALSEKLSGGLPGTAKFVIAGEGALMVDGSGVRAGDEEADVTITADRETFEGLMSGDVNPTAAFMQGKLSIDGDMGLAMQLGAALG
ncbi:MAG: SCP2 sterol-binding domain-containing protein [Rhodobacteraceae bacterium]|jgi:putative sterol carrier protein|uniref:SCP2 sterol-binding domain-containing protein n=1 Tax=Albidovulum sp. TaxID=1872424 RepID=UPI001E006FF5|nr:SCP2 sterol-binding domain-containing protein [uncultured Defluviimonas sp.]MCB2124832.1 SCP2 sterol-binding domain-containing protein [Paracoccaceae bacterium]MCC0069916.1 SCP2 sterol-binding domain-containing protein [Paracoccaceae bacterium]